MQIRPQRAAMRLKEIRISRQRKLLFSEFFLRRIQSQQKRVVNSRLQRIQRRLDARQIIRELLPFTCDCPIIFDGLFIEFPVFDPPHAKIVARGKIEILLPVKLAAPQKRFRDHPAFIRRAVASQEGQRVVSKAGFDENIF